MSAEVPRINKRNGRRVYLFTAVMLVGIFAVPRIWLSVAEFKDEVGTWAGYVCSAWLGFILLMPTAARLWRGRWSRLMAVRKEFGIGVGFFIIAHGFFSHAIDAHGDMDALNPDGTGCGFINLFTVIVLLITSIDRVRLSMSRTWWEMHQRVGTFGMFFLGTMAASGSQHHPTLSKVALAFTFLVFAIRVLQLWIDRAKARGRRLALNAAGFVLFFGFAIASELTHRFYTLSLILGAVLLVVAATAFAHRRLRANTREL